MAVDKKTIWYDSNVKMKIERNDSMQFLKQLQPLGRR